MSQVKQLIWVGSTLKDLKEFTAEVKDEIGFALHQVQEGKTPQHAKPLKGFGSGVMEIVCDFNTNTFRAVYTVQISETVYVLHVFQKKLTTGIKTSQKDLRLIMQRLKLATIIAESKGVLQ
jgi:phage-related protein